MIGFPPKIRGSVVMRRSRAAESVIDIYLQQSGPSDYSCKFDVLSLPQKDKMHPLKNQKFILFKMLLISSPVETDVLS
jgi:Holliday junction resolvase-like predicted endonuclease